jgi:Zn-finger nucleic acid-binding protein
MQCPKCEAELEAVTYAHVEVDRCTVCRGIWFDRLEKEDLTKFRGSDSIDIGDIQIGKEQDQLRDINCPRCDVKMLSMIDKDQFHISYESCPNCYGTFFDAGEFKDYSEHTIIERFKQMVDTVRSNLQ